MNSAAALGREPKEDGGYTFSETALSRASRQDSVGKAVTETEQEYI